jgi:lipoyl(octanoyl) transferase
VQDARLPAPAGSLRRTLEWSFLGTVGYTESLDLQEETRDRLLSGRGPESLLLLEHPHVYTLGRNARRRDIVADGHWLRARGVQIVDCDRGGQVTYHGPGQLVGYPIVDLDPDRRDLRRYVADLQEVLIRTLSDLGIEADRGTSPEAIGVWVGPRKIASLGVHIRRWVTTHGFALNLATDLSFFGGIVPCGLSGVEMTSVERLTGERPDIRSVAAICAGHFCRVFSRRGHERTDRGAEPSS